MCSLGPIGCPHRPGPQGWQALPTHLPVPAAQGAKAGEYWGISRQWSKLNGRVPHRIRDFSPQILQILVRSKYECLCESCQHLQALNLSVGLQPGTGPTTGPITKWSPGFQRQDKTISGSLPFHIRRRGHRKHWACNGFAVAPERLVGQPLRCKALHPQAGGLACWAVQTWRNSHNDALNFS